MDNSLQANSDAIIRGSVYEMQLFLQAARADIPNIPFVAADGIYGPDTAAAVRAFQTANHLTPTGVTDQETWDLARSLYYRMLRKNSPPCMPNVFSCTDWDISPNQNCDQVYVVQLMLKRLGDRYSGFNDLDMTGAFDEKTQKAFSLLCMEGTENYCVGKCIGKNQMNDLTQTYNGFMDCNKYKVWDTDNCNEDLEGIVTPKQES